jgi:peptidyl-prolyl cis-trans isomerase C
VDRQTLPPASINPNSPCLVAAREPLIERSLVNRIALWTVVALALVAGAWTLGRKAPSHAAGTSAAEGRSAVDAPAERPTGDFILATVNGEPIYHSDFVLAVQSLPPAAQPIAAKPVGKRLVLDQIVKMKVLKQEAESKGMAREPEIAVQLSYVLDSMLAEVALEKLVSGSPQELRAFYDAYTNQFRGARVRQILVAYDGGIIPPKSGGKALAEPDARKKAEDIARRIRSGEDFASVAASVSDDVQSAGSGGSLGLVRPGQLGSVLDGAIETLEINQVSDPIRSAYGYHVFEVTGREISTFEEIENSLRQQGEQLRAHVVVNDLKEKARVEIENKEFFETFVP